MTAGGLVNGIRSMTNFHPSAQKECSRCLSTYVRAAGCEEGIRNGVVTEMPAICPKPEPFYSVQIRLDAIRYQHITIAVRRFMAPRWFRENGAVPVRGPDLSRDMIDRARAGTDDAAIDYRIADLDTLELPEAAFDLAYSALIFNYVWNSRVADGGDVLCTDARRRSRLHLRTPDLDGCNTCLDACWIERSDTEAIR